MGIKQGLNEKRRRRDWGNVLEQKPQLASPSCKLAVAITDTLQRDHMQERRYAEPACASNQNGQRCATPLSAHSQNDESQHTADSAVKEIEVTPRGCVLTGCGALLHLRKLRLPVADNWSMRGLKNTAMVNFKPLGSSSNTSLLR